MKSRKIIDIFCLSLVSLYLLHFLPGSILNQDPATGGDTGSHFWPLVTLVQNSLPELSLRTWNPGNLGGEPQLIHYFPLPYLIMAFLSLFVPIEVAFNIGTFLPLLMLPICIYAGTRLMGLAFPAPILSAAFSLIFLYNESFTMWGGNALSTMAGQFAHGYALAFLFLGIGFISSELRQNCFPWKSALMFAAVCLSHAYIMLGIPFFFLSFLIFYNKTNLFNRFKVLFYSGTFALLLSAWFIVPMLDNSYWSIPHSFKWYSSDLLAEVIPDMFYPVLLILLISYIIVRSLKHDSINIEDKLKFWIIPIIGYVIYYFIFPYLKVVDVRAFPQAILFVCILTGIYLARALSRTKRHKEPVTLLIVILLTIYSDSYVKNFPGWVNWNYSGWKSKTAYPELSRLYNFIRGDFSKPRIVYEHNTQNNVAGTERVFEMLPYFANRATLESVYLQASLLSPAAFLIQAEISKTPSCPFNEFPCNPHNIVQSIRHLKMLGVGQLILLTPEAIQQAKDSAELEFQEEFGKWNIFKLKEQPKMAEVFATQPIAASNKYWSEWLKTRGSDFNYDSMGDNWKGLLYAWLKNYKIGDPMIVVDKIKDKNIEVSGLIQKAGSSSECHPEIIADINKLQLKTDCPGKAHFLKFAYHPSWKTDSEDQIFLVSPGFMAIVPSKNEINFSFGESYLWKAADILSLLSLAFLPLFAIKSRKQ